MSEQNLELSGKILGILTEAHTIGQIGKTLGVETTTLRPVLRQLRKDNKVSVSGNRRGARYSLTTETVTA